MVNVIWLFGQARGAFETLGLCDRVVPVDEIHAAIADAIYYNRYFSDSVDLCNISLLREYLWSPTLLVGAHFFAAGSQNLRLTLAGEYARRNDLKRVCHVGEVERMENLIYEVVDDDNVALTVEYHNEALTDAELLAHIAEFAPDTAVIGTECLRARNDPRALSVESEAIMMYEAAVHFIKGTQADGLRPYSYLEVVGTLSWGQTATHGVVVASDGIPFLRHDEPYGTDTYFQAMVGAELGVMLGNPRPRLGPSDSAEPESDSSESDA